MTESIFDLVSFEKFKNDICSESKNVRKNCLDKLQIALRSGNYESQSIDKLAIFKVVIEVFTDKSEACRERAVKLAIEFVKEWNIPEDEIMFRLLPVIHKQLVARAVTESAEEVRLCLINLVRVIVQKYGIQLGPHLKDLVEVLIRCICDDYPEVKKEGCECASDLAEIVPEFRLHSESVISVVLKVLKHKHSRVRISAINSLKNIVQYGHPGAIEMVYGALGECLLDSNAQIRFSVLKVTAFWFTKLRDRYSYFRYLLPLVLIELTDDIESNREEAHKLWHDIGLQYLEENQEDLKEKDELLPKELEYYPVGVKRPNIGCRTIVQNEMKKIIPTVMHELKDWKPEVRIKSSELFRTIVLHGEDRIVSCFDVALSTMCKACMDEEPLVYRNAAESAEIMGYFVPTDMFWKISIRRLKENPSPGHYLILAALLKHNPASYILENIDEIITDLADSEVRETREERCQNSLLDIISKLLDCLEKSSLDDEKLHKLYLTSVSILAFGNDKVRKRATDFVKGLAEIASNSSVSDLNGKCLPRVLNRLIGSCSIWESYSLDFNILLALLSKYTDDVFKYVASEVLQIMDVIFNQKAVKEVIFKMLQQIGKLFEQNEFDFKNNAHSIERIILGPLKTQLIWRAGKSVEVIRCTAVCIVLLFIQKSTALSRDFTVNIHPLLLSLCEDGYDETRIYSLQALPFLGQNEDKTMEADIFVKSFNVVTERLNDKSNSVRLTAANTARILMLRAPDMNTFDSDSKLIIIQGLRMILLNADDDDRKIRDAILGITEHEQIVTRIKSVMPENDVKNCVRKFHHTDVADLLKKHLNI